MGILVMKVVVFVIQYMFMLHQIPMIWKRFAGELMERTLGTHMWIPTWLDLFDISLEQIIFTLAKG